MVMKRNGYIDFVKGIAMLLVLVGHAIQYCSGSEYFLRGEYYDNPLFRFIYTFHMPLFMAVSGYLLQQSLRHRSEIEVALRHLRQLGLPILSFGLLAFGIKWVVSPIGNIGECVKMLFHTCVGNLWFLWALLYNQFLLLVIRRMNDRIWLYCIVGLVLYIVPDCNCLPARYTFLYPFLIAGYMVGKHMPFHGISMTGHKANAPIVTLLLYVLGLYITRTILVDVWEWGLIGRLLHTMMNQLIALLALTWILPLLYMVYKAFPAKRSVAFVMYVGQNSLGIYYCQTLIFILISRICNHLPSLGIWGAIIGGVVITAECVLFSMWSKRCRVSRLLVFGLSDCDK